MSPNTHIMNADLAKVVHCEGPGKYNYILWQDYSGCCKPGEFDDELGAMVTTCDPHLWGQNHDTWGSSSSIEPTWGRRQEEDHDERLRQWMQVQERPTPAQIDNPNETNETRPTQTTHKYTLSTKNYHTKKSPSQQDKFR